MCGYLTLWSFLAKSFCDAAQVLTQGHSKSMNPFECRVEVFLTKEGWSPGYSAGHQLLHEIASVENPEGSSLTPHCHFSLLLPELTPLEKLLLVKLHKHSFTGNQAQNHGASCQLWGGGL